MPCPAANNWLLIATVVVVLLALCQVSPGNAASGSGSGEDYYKLLGVQRTATAAQIKRAFKKLVMEKHPDRNKADPNANALFMRINRAYEILKSPELKERYDRYGEAGIKAHEEEGQQQDRHSARRSGLFADDPQIVKLTAEQYEALVKDGEQIWFVNFYASQFKRSETYAQLWRDVGHELEDVIRIAAVDCQEAGYLCENIPELRTAEPPAFIFYPGRDVYTGSLTKEAMTDAALKRFKSAHFDLTSGNLQATLAKPGAPAHWLLSFCSRQRDDCFSDRTLKKLAAVFHDFVGIGRVDCHAEPELCRQLNPAAVETADAVSARLFVNASSALSSSVSNSPGQLGLPVASLHTQETARAVLSHLPALKAFDEVAIGRLSGAIFDAASLRSGHLVLIQDGSSAASAVDASLKRLEPLLRPHKIRVGRLVCGAASAGTASGQLCRRLGLAGQKLPVCLLVKRTGGYEVFYGQMHYMDIKEFALQAAGSPLTSLNSETYQSLVANPLEGTIWFVDFFAPWCPPCMKALPEFREAARLYASQLAPSLPAGKTVRFGGVDCTVERAICDSNDVTGYPTLLLMLSGDRRVKFRGSKFAQQMLAFAEAFVLPAATFFNRRTFEAAIDGSARSHAWMVYFHSVRCQPCVEFMPELNGLAKNFKDHKHIRIGAVDCVTHKDLCNAHGIRSYPTIRAFPLDKTGPTDYFDYNSPFRDGESVGNWLQGFAPQAVMRFNRGNFQSELASAEPWVVYFYADWCGPCQAYAPTFKAVADSLKLHANFGKVDCDTYQDLCSSKGIQSMPSVALYKGGKMLAHLTGQSVYTIEAKVTSLFSEKRDAPRVFYSYHGNANKNARFVMDGGGGGGGGWQRVVINNGDGATFFMDGDGMPFQFHHDEF